MVVPAHFADDALVAIRILNAAMIQADAFIGICDSGVDYMDGRLPVQQTQPPLDGALAKCPSRGDRNHP